ncbi:transposase, partial [Armatimonas sp.]|uniref:transposase n=1 Tax=Armatimonas sp. TaxID=1872638 RepID=UPI002869FAE2
SNCPSTRFLFWQRVGFLFCLLESPRFSACYLTTFMTCTRENPPLTKGYEMKAGEMTDEQIVAILQEADKGDKKLADLCREKGISVNTFYTWKKKFQGMQTNEVKRLRELEKENARLKRLLAERDLDVDILKELVQKNS